MIITCPHCQTRYQVAQEAIGAVGRKVQCAHCMKAWQAAPTPSPVREVPRPSVRHDDRMFDEMAEQQLDAAIEAEARAVALAEQVIANANERATPEPSTPPAAAPAPSKVDQALHRKRQRAFSRRQHSLTKRLPLARVRRVVRVAATVALLVVVSALYFLRTDIVRQFPDMAGVYEGLGLGINVIGLNFRDVTTLRTLRDGKDMLIVNARIVSESSRTALVPPVIVTLLSADGAALYEWSVAPASEDLEPGEVVDFETQLTGPPDGATGVKLTFANARVQSGAPIVTSEAN